MPLNILFYKKLPQNTEVNFTADSTKSSIQLKYRQPLKNAKGFALSSEKLFTTIKDGAWHNLNELADQIGVPVAKLIECAYDLCAKGIVRYQEDSQRIKIEPEWKILIPDEKLTMTTQYRTAPNRTE